MMPSNYYGLLLVLAALVPSSQAKILWEHVCGAENTAHSAYGFCDTALPLDQRVYDYMQRIPTAQKIAMMVHDAAAFPDYQIPRYQWWSEGLHGALQPCVCDSKDNTTCKCPTSFPAPSALGSALNHSLWYNIARTIGQEARAIANLRPHSPDHHDYFLGHWSDYDGLTYWSPTLNLQRDPRWGRNQESPSEDPLVVSNYARAFVHGLQQQQNESSSEVLQIAACCKHWVGNSLEGRDGDPDYTGPSRHNVNANISAADMGNYYARPFQACVGANAMGVMCSYNAVNGIPSCAHGGLLQHTLREAWNFTGYVVSDCGAVRDIVEGHQYTTDNATAVAQALQAGTDVNCGSMYAEHLPEALARGLVSPKDIDTAFARLVRIQMKLGLFDATNPYASNGLEEIDNESSRQLSLEAAHQSIVLLKNDRKTTDDTPVLPFSAPIDRLAVIGPHVEAKGAFLGNYHGQRCQGDDFWNEECILTPLQALTEANQGGSTVGVKGCKVSRTDYDDIDAAVKEASQANKIILLMGLDQSVEEEGRDRINTTLPGLQLQLLKRILALENPNTAVVIISGGQVSLGKELIEAIPALVFASYGGQSGAQALADVLFGRYNPTGKLMATMYPPEYTENMPMEDLSLSVGEGRTHMYYTGEPDFAFGSGLSYSSWAVDYDDADIRPLELTIGGPPVDISIRVTNQGSLSGGQTVLLFWLPLSAGVYVQQVLLAYESTSLLLEPGQAETLLFSLESSAFSMTNNDGTERVHMGSYELRAVVSGGVMAKRLLYVMSDNVRQETS